MLATTGVVNIVSAATAHSYCGRGDCGRSEVDGVACRREALAYIRIGEVRYIPVRWLEWKAFFLRIKDSCRLVISVTLLGRSVATEIDAAYTSPL